MKVIFKLPTFPTRERKRSGEGPDPVLGAMGRLFLSLLVLLKALKSVRTLAGYVASVLL